MNTEDRRAPGASRMPFDALVEVGGALGPSCEAQAVNVSEEGIHLRTAYLPEQGQPLTCRFDAGPGHSVLASGEVVWSNAADKGGEFGVRFTDMDAISVDALKGIMGTAVASGAAGSPQALAGSKVRLHIDGLASPMRAKVRDSRAAAVTVGSDLGFLQVGRQLELEDATNGCKRPASIDRVEVAVDPASHVPQLVVTLKYADVKAEAPAPGWAAASSTSASSASSADDLAAVEEASAKMKGALAQNLQRVGPAVERLAERAKTMVALLAKRRREEPSPARRTTAPPPGGGLHASGRRVVRGEEAAPLDENVAAGKSMSVKRKAAVAGAVMLAAVLGALALKKTHHDPATDASAAAAPSSAAATDVAPAASAAPTPAPDPMTNPAAQPAAPMPLSADDMDVTNKASHKHHHVAPFGNGAVHHGNVLRIKMDGPIEALEGAQQPTGFTVKVPGRKSVEAAAPLAARDSRIAAIKVENEGAGAELSVTFRDGVPNYQVSAHGDSLVIALAPAGTLDAVAKKDEKGSKAKHGKHSHEKKSESL
jgi:PilZ domain